MTWPSAAAGETPIGTSSVITATSASRSMPKASSATSIGSVGPRKPSEAPWYIKRIVQELGRQLGTARAADERHVVQIGAAVGELVGARQGCGAGGRLEREHVLGPQLVPLELCRRLLERRGQRRPVVEGRLQGRRDPRHLDRAHKVIRDDHEAAIAPRPLERGELHVRPGGAAASPGARQLLT